MSIKRYRLYIFLCAVLIHKSVYAVEPAFGTFCGKVLAVRDIQTNTDLLSSGAPDGVRSILIKVDIKPDMTNFFRTIAPLNEEVFTFLGSAKNADHICVKGTFVTGEGYPAGNTGVIFAYRAWQFK